MSTVSYFTHQIVINLGASPIIPFILLGQWWKEANQIKICIVSKNGNQAEPDKHNSNETCTKWTNSTGRMNVIYTCPSLFISLLTWKLLHCNTFSQFHEKLLTFNLLFCNCYSTIDVQGYDTMGIVLNDRAGFVDFDRQVNRWWKQRLKLDYKNKWPGRQIKFFCQG